MALWYTRDATESDAVPYYLNGGSINLPDWIDVRVRYYRKRRAAISLVPRQDNKVMRWTVDVTVRVK